MQPPASYPVPEAGLETRTSLRTPVFLSPAAFCHFRPLPANRVKQFSFRGGRPAPVNSLERYRPEKLRTSAISPSPSTRIAIIASLEACLRPYGARPSRPCPAAGTLAVAAHLQPPTTGARSSSAQTMCRTVSGC